MQMRAEIGLRIKLAREVAKLKQGELARVLNVSQGSISGWENGTTGIELPTLVFVAKALRVPIEYFLEPFGLQSNASTNAAESVLRYSDRGAGERKRPVPKKATGGKSKAA